MEITAARRAVSEARLYGILDLSYVAADGALDRTRRMLDGGVQILQLRAKNQPLDLIERLAKEVSALTSAAGVPFIINDHPALVQPTGADGAHVGQDDLTVEAARGIISDVLVGKSTHSVAQATAAGEQDLDYIGFGPLFATPTKPDYTPIGTAEITEVHRLVKHPIFCIGGVKLENLETVLAAGAKRVVIVSGILLADDVTGYCRRCRALLDAVPLA